MSIVFGGTKVFDQSCSGLSPFYSKQELQRQIASAEKFTALIKTTGVTGTGPTMKVDLEHSNDAINWVVKTNLVAGGTAISNTITFTPQDTGTTTVGGAFMRLAVTLGGTTPAAYVEIWLTGRTLD